VVGTWGGDFGDILRDGVDVPLMKPAGIEVLQDISGPVQRRTKLFAERQNRRGSMDVACLADFDMFAAAQQNALEALTEETVPRLAKVLPLFHKPSSIPQIYSAHTIVYNTARVPVAPKSIHDLWDPKYRGRVGLTDFLFTTNTAFAAMAGGGSMTDFEPAKKKLMEWRSLDVKVFASVEATAAALKSEEIWFTIIAAARAYMWRQAGLPLGSVIAEEGAFPTLYEAAVPRNARNRETGLRYLNAMLEPGPQRAFAARMGYVPTVSDAPLDPDLDRQINFSEAERARFWKPDFGYLVAQQGAMLDFWNRDFKG
jgi:putative spermidine/putrescine transport system substrate-binding protein